MRASTWVCNPRAFSNRTKKSTWPAKVSYHFWRNCWPFTKKPYLIEYTHRHSREHQWLCSKIYSWLEAIRRICIIRWPLVWPKKGSLQSVIKLAKSKRASVAKLSNFADDNLLHRLFMFVWINFEYKLVLRRLTLLAPTAPQLFFLPAD